jgi:leucyl-tRNA synthetase
MKRYDPSSIEPKWQKIWEENKIYQASNDTLQPKKYVLEYFPYPSGVAMHVGHVRNYSIGDVISRYYRMKGYNVLHPMGWDAFGLPAENYAIKNNVSPRVAIDENTSRFKQQLIQMGFGYDWSREIDSTDPNYYRWTQWFFLFLFKKGLAYQKESLQWWCPVDKTVLANEQVEAGKCWRCGQAVEKKALKQWFFKNTDYADRLLNDLDDLDWSNSIKTMQRNWIGKSHGNRVQFLVEGTDQKIEVFTTAIDTIYGVTFMVLSPEHELVQKITTKDHHANVNSYIHQAQSKSEIERQDESKEKTGTFTGAYALNPANKQKIPIWIADYVLAGYGTGAIMAVPGEDLRDFEFATKYELPIVYTTEKQEFINYQTEIKSNLSKYKMANSDEFDGLDFKTGRQKIIEKLETEKVAITETQYKMRDCFGVLLSQLFIVKTTGQLLFQRISCRYYYQKSITMNQVVMDGAHLLT